MFIRIKLLEAHSKQLFFISKQLEHNLFNMPRSIKNVKMEEIKTEKAQDDNENAKVSVTDLCKFKFQKKPHIKIEFDEDSTITDSNIVGKSKASGIWQPPNWMDFLVNLRIMRENTEAPVDTMGCHMAMDENAPPEVMRYHSLIALMLSSQTKDQVTFAAMQRLREKGLTIDNVLKMSDEELGKLIYPVGFWKTKVKYIKKTTQTLKDQYNGDIPDSVEKLCKLTGVGPKMAHICMKVAWNKVTGIGVDTHVHRISNRIGWVRKPTATPEDTRKALQFWLPFELWSEVNHLMVGFGQTICLPVNPQCHECLNRDICPSSGKVKKSPKKSPIKKEIKQENLDYDFVDSNKIVKKAKSPRKRKSTGDELLKDSESQDGTTKATNSNNKLLAETSQIANKKISPNKKNTVSKPKINTTTVVKESNTKVDSNTSDSGSIINEQSSVTTNKKKAKSQRPKSASDVEGTSSKRVTRASNK